MKLVSRRMTQLLWFAGALFLAPLAAHSSNPNSKFAGVYQSDVPKAEKDATEKPFASMNVSLGADGTATVTEDPGKGSRTSFGHWKDSGGEITITFDAVGQPSQPPMVFRPSHDGLQAVTWNHALWGQVTPPLVKKGNADWHSHRKLF
ncbi:MAG TPA: hypothetical protein VGR96_10820 [Acidobacteriaceae bacterium]|nr:hypothetical protein [Acidobacteriaceae bacterium]